MLNVSIQKSVLPQNLRKGIIFPLHAQDVKIDSLPVNSQTPVPPTADSITFKGRVRPQAMNKQKPITIIFGTDSNATVLPFRRYYQ